MWFRLGFGNDVYIRAGAVLIEQFCVCGVQGSVSQEEYSELQSRIAAAEQALADKQQKIDLMKQELYEKDKELETISVFKAQVLCVRVYS